MKKAAGILGICLFILLSAVVLWDNCFPTIYQETMNISKRQGAVIDKVLKEYADFECVNIEKADLNNPVLQNMSSLYEAYTIIDGTGKRYILIIEKEDAEPHCVLDEENYLVYGLADNTILPNYFVDGEVWYEESVNE